VLNADRSLSRDNFKLKIQIDRIADSARVHFLTQHDHVIVPVQFLGRYSKSTTAALFQRSQAAEKVHVALLEEQLKRKQLDKARTSARGVTEEMLAKCVHESQEAEVGAMY
jgi:hypothetical protein